MGVVITHYGGLFGPSIAFADYMIKLRYDRVFLIKHPIDGRLGINRIYEEYHRGKLVLKKEWKSSLSGPFQYFSDWMVTRRMVKEIASKYKINILLGADPLNYLAVHSTRVKADKSIFYSVDYSPRRFSNPVLNSIYRWFDHRAAILADSTFNISRRAIAARVAEGSQVGKMKYTPNGVNELIKEVGTRKMIVVYIGTISKTKGIEQLLRIWSGVIEQEPKAQLWLIGGGAGKDEMVKMIQDGDLAATVKFWGQLPHLETTKLVVQSKVGVALYNDADSYTWFCDPMKVREYISTLTIPVVSSVPEIAEDIEKFHAGEVADTDEEIVKGIVNALRHSPEYLPGLLQMQRSSRWDDIFTSALKD